jgi:hypothetical protein
VSLEDVDTGLGLRTACWPGKSNRENLTVIVRSSRNRPIVKRRLSAAPLWVLRKSAAGDRNAAGVTRPLLISQFNCSVSSKVMTGRASTSFCMDGRIRGFDGLLKTLSIFTQRLE